jgi:hypothetical protein
MDRAKILALRRRIAIAIATLVTSSVSLADDLLNDPTGKCTAVTRWAFVVEFQAISKACRWARTPSDDAIDGYVAAIEAELRISQSPKAPELLAYVQVAHADAQPRYPDAVCVFDPENKGSSLAFMWAVHNADLAIIEQQKREDLEALRSMKPSSCF